MAPVPSTCTYASAMRSGSPPLCGAFQLQLHFGEEDEARQVVREHCVDVAKSYNVSVVQIFPVVSQNITVQSPPLESDPGG